MREKGVLLTFEVSLKLWFMEIVKVNMHIFSIIVWSTQHQM